jgi:Tol biopolymer transport system component
MLAYTLYPVDRQGAPRAFGSWIQSWVLGAKTSVPLTPRPVKGERRNDFEPQWSPDGSRIAFVRSSTLPGASGIYVIRADGSGLRRIQGLDRQAADVLFPLRWSPDGSTLAYDRYAAEECSASTPFQQRLTLTNVDEPRTTDIALLPRPARYMAIEFVGWSPDGTKLLYVVVEAEYNEVDPTQCRFHRPFTSLSTVGADGRGQHTLISEAEIRTAAWSGDGRRIAYVDCSDAVYECVLGVVRSDGTERRTVATHRVPTNPLPLIWTPNGNEVVANLYLGDKSDSTGLFAINLQTRRRRLLYQAGGDVYGFSPDRHDAVIVSGGKLLAVPLTGKAARTLGAPPVPKGFDWGSDNLFLR